MQYLPIKFGWCYSYQLRLSVHRRVDHTSLTPHAPKVGRGQNVGLRDFDFVDNGGIRVSQTRLQINIGSWFFMWPFLVHVSRDVRRQLFTCSNSPQKPLEYTWRNFTRSKYSTSYNKFVFSGRSENQDGHPGLRLAKAFLTSLQLLNLTKLERMQQVLFVLHIVCVFWDKSENQDGRYGLWLRDFGLLCINWTKLHKTWQEA